MDKLHKLLKSIDENKTYFNIHAGDVVGSVFLIIIILLIFLFMAVKKNNIIIRKEWQKNKCKPEYAPVAGFINAPPGSSFNEKLEFTKQNFNSCNVGILETNVKMFTTPLANAQNIIKVLFEMAKKIILKIHIIFKILKEKFLHFISEIFGKVAQILIEVQKFLFKIKDTFMKSAGVLQAIFLIIVAQAYTLITFINALIESAVVLLIILTAIISFLLSFAWFLPMVFIPPAIALLAVYLAIGIPLLIVIIFSATITEELERRENMVCFYPETKIKLKNGKYKSMKNLNLGEKLSNNIEVIAVLRIKGTEKDKYYKIYSQELKDYIFVTGSHLIMHPETKKFITVANFKNSEITNSWTNEMSCLVTSTHKIPIGEYIFWDWED